MADRLDQAWLLSDSGVVVWADVTDPTDADGAVLRESFGVHGLAVEAALRRETHPKVESYGAYLYIVLHEFNLLAAEHGFDTHETAMSTISSRACLRTPSCFRTD